MGIQQLLSLAQTPTGFYSQWLWELIFLALEPWPGGHDIGLGPLTPKISLPNFYPPHVGMRPACSMSLSLRISTSPCVLSVWMDVVPLVL